MEGSGQVSPLFGARGTILVVDGSTVASMWLLLLHHLLLRLSRSSLFPHALSMHHGFPHQISVGFDSVF